MAKVTVKSNAPHDVNAHLSPLASRVLGVIMRGCEASAQTGVLAIPRNEEISTALEIPGTVKDLGLTFMKPKDECRILLCKTLEETSGDAMLDARQMWRKLEKASTPEEMDAQAKIHIKLTWGEFGTGSEEVRTRRIQRAVNAALGEQNACPISFATRLYRLGIFERQDLVLSSNNPTPLTLPQIEAKLTEHEKNHTLSDGVALVSRGRSLSELSSRDLERSSSSTMKLLESMLPEFNDSNIAKLVSWLLTGVETSTHMTDWRKKSNRRIVANELLDAAEGDAGKVNTVKLVDDHQGLMNYYLQRGAQSPREALISLLDEFGMLSDEQRLKIQLRQNRPLQLKRILQHYDPKASTPSYAPIIFVSTSHATAILRECEEKIAQAIDGGATPQELSLAFGISAGFSESLIKRFSGGRERRGEGSSVSLFNITNSWTRGEPLGQNLFALTLGDLGETLGWETRILRGILPGKRNPSGRVSLGRMLAPLNDDASNLSAACISRHYDVISGLSEAVVRDARRIIDEVSNPTDEGRSISIRLQSGRTQKRFAGDRQLEAIAGIAEHAGAEAKYWMQH